MPQKSTHAPAKPRAPRLAIDYPDQLTVNDLDHSQSILVKENYDPTREKLMAVTVMYRSKGYAPDGGDWYWTKYEPDGKVSTMKCMRITGRVSMCVECHKSAGGDDYVFANDPR